MTTSDCLISVVIPVYNTPIKKIARCLNSICSDDMTALEAIVVDDGSKPEFSASYRSLCGAYQNIRLRQEITVWSVHPEIILPSWTRTITYLHHV